MKILKNLLGNNSKIDIDEIASTINNKVEPLSDLVIVESGSNANGNYVRFGNGMMVCFGEFTFDRNKDIDFFVYFPVIFSSAFRPISSGETTASVADMDDFSNYILSAGEDRMRVKRKTGTTHRGSGDLNATYVVIGFSK